VVDVQTLGCLLQDGRKSPEIGEVGDGFAAAFMFHEHSWRRQCLEAQKALSCVVHKSQHFL
jgi:hypothetical protein